MKATSRRQFLGQCAGAAAGAWLLPDFARRGGKLYDRPVKFPSAPRERVAVAAYPFREFIVGWKGWDGKSPSTVPASQQMELKDFAAHVAEKFNVHKIEPWSRVFPSTDPKYLEQFRAAVEKLTPQSWTSRWMGGTASILGCGRARAGGGVEQAMGGRGSGARFAEHSHPCAGAKDLEAGRRTRSRHAGARGGIWREKECRGASGK